MPAIQLDNLSIGYPILHSGHRSLKKSFVSAATGGKILRESRKAPYVQALKQISASIQAGDKVGLVGPNGAGKTTLLRAIAGIYEPMSGQVYTEGRITALLDVGLGVNIDMTGRENIMLRGNYMGIRPKEMAKLAPEIEAFTELDEYLDMPLRTYSAGMRIRLVFGIATSVKPDVLLMDEWVMAGDAAFLDKAKARMQDFVSSSSILVLASHNNAIISKWCNKAMFLLSGELVAFGEVQEVLERYNDYANKRR